MTSPSWNWNPKISDVGLCDIGFVDHFWVKYGKTGGGLVPVSESLVLDGKKGELVKEPGRGLGKKGGVGEEKAMAALKSHSEAERRRRERINGHLATLRGLVPCSEKMDKATLLAEVIGQVKQLNKTATEASEGLLIPVDADEVRVEPLDETAGDKTLYFKASLCCDYRPDLMSDLRQALDALHVNTVSAEISTLGCRVKYVFVFTSGRERNCGNAKSGELLAGSVHQALNAILDMASVSPEYSPRTTLPNKRRRLSLYDNSSSSF
ncbi:hypothetical protein RJ640_017329 [Escallonia rubra]|uniref:BHLH domain-containing protein n=1 Tax=Escallonia rubra TaxID=112253 RepID=A0AA88QX98_9ASTE|nr:hypothetical protein RJ640_017329 [Escallonia rubra]